MFSTIFLFLATLGLSAQSPCDKADFSIIKTNNGYVFDSKTNGLTVTKYNWSYGDGTYGSGSKVDHTYSKSGNYNVCLILNSYYYKENKKIECNKTICKTVEYKKCELSGDFSFTRSGKYISLIAKSNMKDVKYVWSYGDEKIGYGIKSKHKYSKPGSYDVCLTIYSKECQVKICRKIVVEEPCKLTGDFGFSVKDGNFTFEGTSNTKDVEYYWELGDGTKGKGKVFTHKYTKPGDYKVCLIVVKGNCKTTVCKNVNIEEPCNLQAYLYFSKGTQKGTYTFEGMPNDPTYTYKWTFGDNTYGTGRVVTHTYKNYGSYEVCLTVTKDNCSKTYCKTVEYKTNLVDDEDQFITIYPNPADEYINVLSNYPIEIYSINGVLKIKSSSDRIDISNLDDGYYFIVIEDSSGIRHYRRIHKRRR